MNKNKTFKIIFKTGDNSVHEIEVNAGGKEKAKTLAEKNIHKTNKKAKLYGFEITRVELLTDRSNLE